MRLTSSSGSEQNAVGRPAGVRQPAIRILVEASKPKCRNPKRNPKLTTYRYVRTLTTD